MVVPETAAGGDSLDQITDDMIGRLTDESCREATAWHRPICPNPALLVPIAHGFAAVGTFVLAVMTASM